MRGKADAAARRRAVRRGRAAEWLCLWHLRLRGWRILVQVTIPDEVWAKAQTENSASLAVGWDAEPAGRASIEFGTNWIHSGTSALLVVPSVIVPEEFNVLINAQHSDSARITAAKVRKWLHDPRLTKTA
ncbi:MAG TPA: RES family NAD+ phosphorylase [Stellaceae bacterium]|nr:RES family NAD+ phosphorylase [Stellaceae bacterium]